MAPRTTVECGMAIAGIQDDNPFTKFEVYSETNSIVVNTRDQVLALFENAFWQFTCTLSTIYNMNATINCSFVKIKHSCFLDNLVVPESSVHIMKKYAKRSPIGNL